MKFVKKSAFLVIILCSWIPCSAQDYVITKKVISVEDGLADRTIQDVFRDSRGFTWFGTANGLNRYDGHQLTSFTQDDGHLLHSQVGEINEDARGNLWIAHSIPPNNQVIALSIFDPRVNQSTSLETYLGYELPFKQTAIKLISDTHEAGDILLTTLDHEVYVCGGDSLKLAFLYQHDESIDRVFIRGEHIWIIGRSKVVKLDHSGAIKKELPRPGYHYWLGIDAEGRILSSSFDRDLGFNTLIFTDTQPHFFLPAESPTSYRILGLDTYNNRVWIESYTSQTLEVYTLEGALLAKAQNDEVYDPYAPSSWIDKAGNFWDKQGGKIFSYTLTQSNFRTFLTDGDSYGTQSYNTRGMVVIGDTLYANGLGHTFAIHLQTGEKKPIISGTEFYTKRRNLYDPLDERKRHAFWLDADQKLWFTDEGFRLSWFEPTNRIHQDYYYAVETEQRDPYPNMQWAIHRDSQGQLWVGHGSGISYLNDVDSLQVLAIDPAFSELSASTVYHIHERGDTLWLATTSGIYLLNIQEQRIVDRYHSKGATNRFIPHDHIAHINEFESDILWMTSKGGGIIKLDLSDNSFRQWTTKDGLTHNETYGIYQDDYGFLWASSANGIMQIMPESFEINSYFESDGLAHNECNTISHYQAADGKLFFGGINGINMLDPKDFLQNSNPSKIYITAFNKQSREDGSFENSIREFLDHDSAFHIYPADLGFQVTYSIIDYQSEKLQYAYRIENFDPQWSYSDKPAISVRSLPYGEYTLVLTGKGTANRSAETIRIPVVIHRPFYLQAWFIMLVVIISGIGIGLIVKWRERSLQEAKIQLEQQVRDRTQELQVEKEQVVKQLHEKELLRQEVHHRVKNNLTFLKGLLYLRANASTSAEVKTVLDECQARIQTMALVHQNLYDVDNTSEVDFKSFINELFGELHTLFDTENKVKLEIESAGLKLDMRLCIFIGLILNELITNSYKYAFHKVDQGHVYIQVHETEDCIKLEYADNGQGLNEGFHPENSTGFGFKIISILLRQTDAELTYSDKIFRLSIPK